MASSDEKNFVLMRYTDDDGGHHTVKVEQTIGENADFGFAAVNYADPMFIRTPRNHPRTVTLLNLVTKRTRTCPVGNRTCDAWSDPAFTVSLAVKGLAALKPYQVKTRRQERLVRPALVANADEFVEA